MNLNLIAMLVSALKPQIAKMDMRQRQAIIEEINALTEALLDGDRDGAIMLLKEIGADAGLVDLVVDHFLFEFEAVDGD